MKVYNGYIKKAAAHKVEAMVEFTSLKGRAYPVWLTG